MEHHRAVGIADLAFGQAERDVRIGGLSFLGVSPRNPHHPPLRRWRGGPTDRRHVTRPAALASRPRSDWLVTLLSILRLPPRPGGPGFYCGALRRARLFKANEEPLSGAVAASGAVTQTLSGERPAGLRTTRAEPFQARTAPAARQGLVCPSK